ncbi:hypothetical protein ACWENS_05635 [Streptomyces sp. NPDC004532]
MTNATDTETFDEFWASVAAARTEVIRGVEVAVPTDMPLAMSHRLEELQDSERDEDLHELVGILFGGEVLADWIDAGMGAVEFQTVLVWGLAHASGQDMSFREAHRVALEAAEGKAPAGRPANRAARRSQSAAGGGPSKRTSGGSTGSARKRSRR